MIDPQTEHLWLNELRHSAESIEAFYRSRRWDFKTEFEIEKLIFLGFFSIRKLLDTKSKKVKDRNISLIEHPATIGIGKDKFYNTLQRKWQDAFDFSSDKKVSLCLRQLCDQFIHTVIYSPFVLNNNKGTLCLGFYFASDKKIKYKEETKDKVGVYYITLKKVIETFLSVVENKPVELEMDFSEDNEIHIKGLTHYTEIGTATIK